LLFVLSFVTCNAFVLHKFKVGDPARCLDGTPAGYYLATGNTSTWVVYLQGGGFCNGTAPCRWDTNPNDISCSCRLNTSLGSSAVWEEHAPPALDDAATSLKGILSSNATLNPSFHTANRIFVPYCDGSLWSGQQEEPVAGFYFAGHLTLLAVLRDLQAKGMSASSSTTVILTGMSAGGVGTFNNLDRVARMLKPRRVVGMPGGGFFLFARTFGRPSWSGFDHAWGAAARTLWGLHKPAFVDESCAAALPAALRYKCMEGPTVAQFVDTAALVAENQYDPAQLYYDGGDSCPGVWDGFSTPKTNCSAGPWAYLQAFGANMSQQLRALPARFGVFSPSCVNHVAPFDALWATATPSLLVAGRSLSDAFTAWLNEESPLSLIEGCGNTTGPCNSNSETCTKPCH